MIRLLRWAINVALLQGMALLVLAWLVPGFDIDVSPSVGIVALIFTLVQLVSWPMFYVVATRLHPLLFPIFSLILSGTLVLFVADQILFWDLAEPRVDNIQTGIVITIGLAISYTIFGGLFSLRDEDAYDWFVTRRIRRSFRNEEKSDEPGTIFIEIDGLAAPLLQKAISDGWMPNLAQWQSDGSHVLNEWETDLSSQTSASQAGILLGSNEGIPAFRWYEKSEGRLMVSSSLTTAKILESRLSEGNGLLHVEGASRWNIFSGDATDSLVTYSTIGARDRGGSRSYISLFASPYLIGRMIALYIGDVFRERWQAFQQRWKKIEPAIRRSRRYAFVRAATTTIMLEFTQFAIFADMHRGKKSVYATVFAYDEVAHHSGIDRIDSLKVLERIDAMIGMIGREAANAARPYRIVVLSDHGQSMGPTFRQRNGETLGELVGSLVDPAARISVHDSLVEDEGHIQLTLRALVSAEDDRTNRLVQRALQRWPRNREEMLNLEPDAGEITSDVMVLASGNLGLISFPQHPDRMTYEEIVDRYEYLLPGLLRNDDIGFVMIRSETEGALVFGRGGIHYLDEGYGVGDDPLAGYGARAADHLRRTDSFSNAPDILVMSAINADTGEVYAFEELVGSHGGLGGWQTRPFVFHPIELEFPSEPVVGAATLHRVLASWLRNPKSTHYDPEARSSQ